MDIKRIFSIQSRGLRYKLIIVVSLMSIIPILAFLNYILPSQIPIFLPEGIPKNKLIIFVVFSLVFLGFWMLKQIVDSILEISSEAKIIARGDYSRALSIKREDEIGDLSIALNQLTSRIKSNMQELRLYGDKTKDINIEIHKRVAVLSSLLQISNSISQGEKLESILQFILDKLTQVASSDFACYLATQEKVAELKLEASSGLKGRLVEQTLRLKQRFFVGLFEDKVNLAVDSQSVSTDDVEELRKIFGVKNILLFSVNSRGKAIGIVVMGNDMEGFLYKPEDLEIVDIFAKQIAVAIENEQLQNKVKLLQIKDALTGLYNKKFIEEHLDDEIKKAIAYQKPCAFTILNINNFKGYHMKFGELSCELVLKRISALLESAVADIDLVGRIGDDEFAIILPARNKRQAITLAEDIKKKTEELFSREENEEKRLTLNSGVSENPLDGASGEILISRAREALINIKDKK